MSLRICQFSAVSNGQPHASNPTLRVVPPFRLFLYTIAGCAFLMVHPVAGVITGLNSTKSNFAVEKTEVQHIWGLWGPERWVCEPWYNHLLGNTSTFNQVGSSSASTIMALLPSMLSFAPVVTAKIGLLRQLSLSHGFIAAAFTFGLPVQQLEVITARSVTSVKKLLGNVEDALSRFGITRDPTPPTISTPTKHTPATAKLNTQDANQTTGLPLDSSSSPQQSVDLSTNGYNDPKSFNDTVENVLALITHSAFDRKRPARIWVQLLMYIFSVLHLTLAWCLVVIILFIDPSNIIWLCPGQGGLVVDMWLLGVFSIVGFMRVRFESKVFAAAEVIYISEASKAMGAGFWERIWYPQPMTVVLRPSLNTSDSDEQTLKSIRSLKVIYLLGILQLCWIMFLSFFFSSAIGGALFRTLLTVSTFIFAVAMSRGLSILTLWLSERYIGLKVIEYDNLQELSVMRRFIGALSGALVEVQDASGSGMSSKDAQWQECVKTYLWGQREGHGNAVHGATHTSRVCTIRTHELGAQKFMDEFIPMVGAMFTVCLALSSPLVSLMRSVSSNPNRDGDNGSGMGNVIPTVIQQLSPVLGIALFSLLTKGRRRIVLCNCGIDTH